MTQEKPNSGFFQNPNTQALLIVIVIAAVACCLVGAAGVGGLVLFGSGVTVLGPTDITAEVATIPSEPDNRVEQPTEPSQDSPAQIEAEVIDVDWYTTMIDSFYLIGIVENTGNVDLVYVQVTAALLDGQGQIVASEYTYADIDVLQVGQVSPFAVLFSEGVPADWVDYEISIEAREASDLDRHYHYTEFEVTSSGNNQPEYGDYAIQGEVQNTGQQTAEFVKVIAILYDADGHITGTDWTYIEQEQTTLNPGGASAFTIDVLNIVNPVDHYDILVEARRVDDSETQSQ